MAAASFDDVHAALVAVMAGATDGLASTTDTSGNLTIESVEPGANGKPRWFGAVQTKKNYVSYHLMPVYENPDLLADISPELKARMQGKSCFNFKAVDEGLFVELGALTEASVRDFSD